MWAIPTSTSSVMKKKKSGKESQYMVSHPELYLDPPIRSDRESGCDKMTRHFCYDMGRHLSDRCFGTLASATTLLLRRGQAHL